MNDSWDPKTASVKFVPIWPPNWINAKDDSFRSYSARDSRIDREDEVLRCKVDSQHSSLVGWFGPIFIIFFVVLCWFAIEDFRHRVAFMLLGATCGTFAFGVIFGLLKHHESRGDYVVVDMRRNLIELPRHGKCFKSDQVLCLQLIQGRNLHEEQMNRSDLNLMVRVGDSVVRYHLIGNPDPQHALEIAKAADTQIYTQATPDGWFRTSDQERKPE